MAHAERDHALLSASGAKRWATCTPSARLEDQFSEESSAYAEEGTLAHELGELILKRELERISPANFKKELKKIQANPLYANEMMDYCQGYADTVIERYMVALAKTPDAQLIIEERLDFSAWVPEGFGTGDILIVTDGMIEVIDLKYGKGVQVEAQENYQMRLYGLGAWSTYSVLYDIQSVNMTIIQPRLDHISTEELSAEELLTWGEEFIKPRAAIAFEGGGEFCAGDHCRFCKVKATCRARAEANLELARFEFESPALLSHDEIGEILAKADQLQQWAKDVQDSALDQAEKHGVKFPGWKLVEGRSNRKFTDEVAVAEMLLIEGYGEDKIYQPRKLFGITEMTKNLGKKLFEEILGPYIEKPPGKPTLVTEDDKRPELNSTAAAVKDFE